MRSYFTIAVLFAGLATQAAAQMTPEQRVTDFQIVAALYAKRYGPANWKQEAFGVNIFDVKPWMERIRGAKDDLEYFQICSEFVAQLRDGHSYYLVRSNFIADLGIFTDVYDDKVLVESINRTLYPANRFPFQVGDEVVSIGGRPVFELIAELSKQRSAGTDRCVRRLAADALSFRAQQYYPRTAELPDQTEVVFRRAGSGETETYTLTWTKTGVPLRQVSPVPTPLFTESGSASDRDGESEYERAIRETKTWAVQPWEVEMRESRGHVNDSGAWTSRNFILGFGSRFPYYDPPAGFQVRRGLAPSDNFFTGTYTANGKRIGWIRIPNFAPASSILAVNEFSAEIAFMKASTDALVVDVSRNTGGSCVGLDYAQRLIPRQFYFFGEYLRPTQQSINNAEVFVRNAKSLRAEQWVIDTFEYILRALQDAAKENRAMTGVLPSCSPAVSPSLVPPSTDQPPLRDANGELVAYDKPIVFLADELSVSFGDIFPAMMQDNKRGPVVGVRTGGWGGSIAQWAVGFYSEALSTVTNSLVIRNSMISAPGLPSRPYVENFGVIPDIDLDFMTRDNLMTRGRPFVESVTRIVLDEIAKGAN